MRVSFDREHTYVEKTIVSAALEARAMRETFLPYALPLIGEDEITEVVDTLRSGWLSSGPKVKRFEQDFADYTGVAHAVAVSSCTAGLHIALTALGIKPGDEVIVPTMTFCATANVVVHLGARPVLVDVDEHGQISPDAVARAITGRTRAIIPVHYAGQACDLNEVLVLASAHNLDVVEDAAHAAGSEYEGRRIGTHGRVAAFSFYATKNMTTGEGGMLTTQDNDLAARMRQLSLHGMSRSAWNRYAAGGSWFYDVEEPGYKNNMTDMQAAIGIHQLRRLPGFIERRQFIAGRYREAFAGLPMLRLPVERPGRNHTYHIFPVRIDPRLVQLDRSRLITELGKRNIGTSVHFIPLHRHSYYRETFGYHPSQFPVAEKLFAEMLSLPLYPKMSDEDVFDVIHAVKSLLGGDTLLQLCA